MDMRLIKYILGLMIFASTVLITYALAGNYHRYEADEQEIYKPQYIFNELNGNFEAKPAACSHSKRYKFNTNSPQLETKGNRSYNVLSYDIYFDWYAILSQSVAIDTNDEGEEVRSLSRFWNGRNIIIVEATEGNVKQLEFDSEGLEIAGISVNGVPIEEFDQPDSTNFLTVELPLVLSKGDSAVVVIDYSYISKKENGGFFLYPEGLYVNNSRKYTDSLGNERVDSFFVESRLAYTMSEPQDARQWMPCNDDPNDKAIASIAIRVPQGYRTASNGLLADSLLEGDMVTYFWKHQYPVTTYLLHAAASKYVEFSEWYRKVSNPSDSIPILYFAWENDYKSNVVDWVHHNAKYMLRTTKSQMETFSTLFGEYPFEKYGIVPVFPFYYGGMEHQTITTVHRNWYIPGSDGGFAHELAHQWLGDLVTCETWKDIWINEGGATWSEALWADKQWKGYYQTMQSKRWGYLYTYWGFGGGLKEPPIYGIPIESLFNTPTTYYKASWVYHMLMELIGKEQFFPLLRKMLQQYAFNNMTTQEFKDFFIAQGLDLPVPLGTYFDQWLIKRGHPVYNIKSASTKLGDSEYEVKVNINQIQEGDNIPDVFVMPVDLLFIKGDSVHNTVTILNDSRNQEYTMNLSYIPDEVRIDSNKVLLQHLESLTTVTESSYQINEVKLYPNPAKGNSICTIDLPIDIFSTIGIEIFDINGNRMQSIYNGSLGAGSYKFSFATVGMASGVYLARISVNGIYLNKVFTVNN